MATKLPNNATLAALPENVARLFVLYAQDAGNWSGYPLVGANVTLLGEREDRGLLSHLKSAGLVTTQADTDNARLIWLAFTPAGIALAAELGIGLNL